MLAKLAVCAPPLNCRTRGDKQDIGQRDRSAATWESYCDGRLYARHDLFISICGVAQITEIVQGKDVFFRCLTGRREWYMTISSNIDE